MQIEIGKYTWNEFNKRWMENTGRKATKKDLVNFIVEQINML
jgi:hypothetical protein